MNPIHAILEDGKIPRMAKVRQSFDQYALPDPAKGTSEALNRDEIKNIIKPGMSIAITAGSRGIANIDIILKEIVGFVKALGGEPFLIPAMGSHGGATAEGQVNLLKSYNITEESTGAPIRATMEVVQICTLADGTPVFIDKYAYEADGVIVVNRIKPHTNFRGPYESGLFKMLAIGLGKQYGAKVVHDGDPKKMADRVQAFGSAILHHTNVLFGVGIIENAYDKTCEIFSLTPPEIEAQEPSYLEKARGRLPKIMFEGIDVLIIDRIGKDISGTGMDPNITHTFFLESGISREKRAKRIVVLDMSDKSHGAGSGIGFADITTRRYFDKMDFLKTYPNTLTVGMVEAVKIPLVMDNQYYAVLAGIITAIGSDKENLRVVRIRDTLHLGDMQISEALLEEAKANPHIEVCEEPTALFFNESGDLF